MRAARLDHVHLYVADRARSAAWYRRVLDLRVLGPEPEDLAPGHPMFLAPAATPTHHCLSLFTGEGASQAHRNVAFAVDAAAFLGFAARLPDAEVTSQRGGPLVPSYVNDYGAALTFDFVDPDGNALELVTYELQVARTGLAA